MINRVPQVLLQRPQINLARSTTTRMVIVSVCAGLGILQSSLTDSFTSLGLAFAATAAALVAEFVINRMTGTRTLRDGSAVTSALVLTLLLPNQINPLLAALGAVFAIAVVKQSFGGLGANWLNPALGGWLFVRFAWPGPFEKALMGVSHTGIRVSEEILTFFGSLDGNITGFLNTTIFALTGSELPEGYINFLFSLAPSIVADRGLLGLLLGTVIIAASQIGRVWIAPLFLGVYIILVRFFGALPGFILNTDLIRTMPKIALLEEGLGKGDILYGFFSGGIIAAAFLLAVEPASGTKTRTGALIVAFLGGVFTFFFQYRGGEPYGAFFAVAVLNLLTPVIRSIERRIFHNSIPNEAGRPL
ncbi:MAG: RnfABCDGE type electron transport complex subunit D [Spirochaetaceae bacterium]|jgi:electron transport complex protein RnfD|nr:RnfABCDGE type electron transport complex subunit D [Spirochaetaceae bacterium]